MDELADSLWLLIVVGALLLASAFFSGSEVALFSLRRGERERMARSNRRVDNLIAAMLARPRRLIATLLIGNEMVNVSISSTLAGIGERVFSGRSDAEVALLTTAAALPLLLLVGEITPKTIAIKAPTVWARMAARPLWLFSLAVMPVRAVVRAVAFVVLLPFGIDARKPPPRQALREDELRALVDAGNEEGAVDARERRLIHRVFEFGDKTVAEVMVPADRAFLLAYNLPLSRILAEVSARGFSRVPIYHKSRDNILGILYAKDLVLLAAGLTSAKRLGELLHAPLFVPRTMRLERLFDIFKERKTHMAIVVNEYGRLAGIVTMEDLLEEIVGPIRDEKEVRRLRTADAGATGERPAPAPAADADAPPAAGADAPPAAGADAPPAPGADAAPAAGADAAPPADAAATARGSAAGEGGT
ncbi:MAG: HlyC/CorC family transporter [Deltaproteobacteria bacterium]|nr:MAG: HlyC/CorC family transporter [Deltaproteobacteria bacterium]